MKIPAGTVKVVIVVSEADPPEVIEAKGAVKATTVGKVVKLAVVIKDAVATVIELVCEFCIKPLAMSILNVVLSPFVNVRFGVANEAVISKDPVGVDPPLDTDPVFTVIRNVEPSPLVNVIVLRFTEAVVSNDPVYAFNIDDVEAIGK